MPAKSLLLLLSTAQCELKKLLRQEEGQDLIEYALLVGFITVVIWATFPSSIFPSMSNIFVVLLSRVAVLTGT